MFAVSLLAVVLSTAPGQAPATQPAPSAGTARAPEASPPRLPVSLGRIRRELAKETYEVERFENFRLLASLQVYGQAPPIELYETEDPANRYNDPKGANRYGAVTPRYGSPTHAEFLSQVTPDNFEAPVMNLSGALSSLSNWISEKRRDAQRRKESDTRQKR